MAAKSFSLSSSIVLHRLHHHNLQTHRNLRHQPPHSKTHIINPKIFPKSTSRFNLIFTYSFQSSSSSTLQENPHLVSISFHLLLSVIVTFEGFKAPDKNDFSPDRGLQEAGRSDPWGTPLKALSSEFRGSIPHFHFRRPLKASTSSLPISIDLSVPFM